MAETLESELTEKEALQLRELLTECVAKMQVAHEQMSRDLEEIEQYRTETRAVIARLGRKAA